MIEREKYERMWRIPEYRNHSPGERHAPRVFIAWGRPTGATLVDLGCGTGRGGQAFAALGMKVTLLDFVEHAPNPDCPLPFVCADLNGPPSVVADYAYCCDVLEHIPENELDAVLSHIAGSMRIKGYIRAFVGPDGYGKRIGETLHVTDRPAAWWAGLARKYFRVLSEDLVDGYAAVIAPLPGHPPIPPAPPPQEAA